MIIGICGQASSGKDTAADAIIKKYPKYRKIKLADRLKDTVSVLFDWNREMLEGCTPKSRKWREAIDTKFYKNTGIEISPRRALQIIGSDCIRDKIASNFWSAIIKNRILTKNIKNAVICDCRYPDEIEMIRSVGGIIMYINRDTKITDTLSIKYGQCVRAGGFINKIKAKWYRYLLVYKYKLHPGEFEWLTAINPDIDIKLEHYINNPILFSKKVEGIIKKLESDS